MVTDLAAELRASVADLYTVREAPSSLEYRAAAEIERLRDALQFIVDRENLTFAECSDAEAIITRAKEALGE